MFVEIDLDRREYINYLAIRQYTPECRKRSGLRVRRDKMFACPQCGKAFAPKTDSNLFCCRECYAKFKTGKSDEEYKTIIGGILAARREARG